MSINSHNDHALAMPGRRSLRDTAKRAFLSLAVAACTVAEAGENLFEFETDFETTADGWYGWNPDSTVPVH